MMSHGAPMSFLELIGFILFVLLFLLAWFLYLWAVMRSNRTYRIWPKYRILSWSLGVVLVLYSVMSPLVSQAHLDFSTHMTHHLLLGMLSPLLLAISAPMTLLLRTLPVLWARKLSHLLNSKWLSLYTHPVVASLLNIGGLWLLYGTSLYVWMHESWLIYLIVHVHMLGAGYLFTVSMIYFDPIRHRFSFIYRSIVLLLALAGHGILAKLIYAYPPVSVSLDEARLGGLIMYYGGDLIDMVIIIVLCWQWFRVTRTGRVGEGL